MLKGTMTKYGSYFQKRVMKKEKEDYARFKVRTLYCHGQL